MWQTQATQTHSFNCQLLGNDRQHKHILSIFKLAKTGNINTLCQLSIVKLAKTNNTETLCSLAIFKVAKTNNTDTLFRLSIFKLANTSNTNTLIVSIVNCQGDVADKQEVRI